MHSLKAPWQKLRARFRRAPKRWIAAVSASLFAGYSLYLGIAVVNEFEQRSWDVPAHVFAAPLELHAGLTLSVTELVVALEQTGHRHTEQIERPGEYRIDGDDVRLWTRAFRFWDAEEPSRRLQVRMEQGQLVSIRDPSGEFVPVVRLEPLRLGSLFANHHEDRILVAPDTLPPLLLETLKTVEDRKFDRHHGIDFRAILRAAWVNIRHGEVRQGGSTLTQQLVKSYFLDGRKTYVRKIREAIMAVALELRYDKSELLHAYVNEIYLGQQGPRAIHGFGLASEFYFSKRPDELGPGEIALLIAIVKGPSFYDPRRQPARATERRNWVLAKMAERGLIDQEIAREASLHSLGVTQREGVASRYQPAFMDMVRAQLARDYSPEELATTGLRVFSTLNPRVQAVAEQALSRGLERLAVNMDEQNESPEPLEPAQGAVVVSRPQSGEVIALVGGRDAGFDGFNRALDAKRPVGSLIKPLVYLAALESGDYTLASKLLDEPIDVALPGGDTWSPGNFTDESHGEVPLVKALAESYNQATVRLGLDIGVERVAALHERLGLDWTPPALPSLLLGAVEMSPFDVAQLYNSLANGGYRTPLNAVRSVTDDAGRPLKRYPFELVSAADTDAVQQLNQALVQVMERGTGEPARRQLPADLVVAGKTGTSDDLRDSWFAGFSDNYLAVVWVGRDENETVGLTGSAGALNIWAPLIGSLAPVMSYAPQASPDLDDVWINFDTGLQTRRGCEAAVLLPVPVDAKLARQPGCGLNLGELGRRVKDWLSNESDRR